MFKNYEIIEHRWIKDLNSDGYILKHSKTGAFVTLLLNDDENKVFYIGFRTPPKDSTGVAHIIEHTVLCGSKKFPVKDPFIELAKGSLNTFLNAMTYPDKTVYPVASCNDKDFHNLVDVYMDAVFNPNIYKEEKIFKQEGWHYEMETPDSPLTINGVVYNEMKGVYSSPDDVVEHEIMTSLFPDSTYGIESGGDPEFIPELTYEEFLAFHGKYYHPSNSFIYLYGNMDATEYLRFLDEEYLSNYEYLKVDSEICVQKAFDKPRYISKEYSVLDEDSAEGTYLTYNVSMGTALDKKLYVALDVIDYVLCSAPGAILKTALIDAGIGEDVYSCVEGGIYQPYFAITAKGAEPKQLDEFVSIIENELEKCTKELPKKSLMAALNYFEFKYREADFGSYPRGLMLGLQALDSWLYDKYAPFMHIEANDTYEFLKKNIDNGYFEDLIKQYFVSNNHKTIIKFEPKVGLTKEKEDALAKSLDAYKNSLTEEEIKSIVEKTKELKEYQSVPSPKEDLEKIPLLKHEDLKKEAVMPINEESVVDDTLLLKHDIFTNGIGYLTLMFNTQKVPAELFPYIGILKSVLGMIDTENHEYGDLFNDINIHTGEIRAGVSSYNDYSEFDKVITFVEIKSKFLYEKMDKAFELIKEILLTSKFEDTKRLYELLLEIKVRLQSAMISAGHSVATLRALSYVSKSGVVSEMISGFPFYELVVDLADNFDERKDELVDKLQRLAVCLFRKENLMVDYTASKEGLCGLEDNIRLINEALYKESYEGEPSSFEPVKKNEAFKTAGQVQFVCRAGNYIEKGLPYTGALKVLRVMMGYDYLWNNVRVLGGAYGCMNSFSRNGNSYFVSYRDPKLKETVEVYEKASDYVANLELDKRQVLQFIIGALSDIDIPMTPSNKGAFSLGVYLSKLTNDDIQKERDELLSVDADTLKGLSKYIDAFMEGNNLCAVGNADIIDENADMFMSVKQLL